MLVGVVEFCSARARIWRVDGDWGDRGMVGKLVEYTAGEEMGVIAGVFACAWEIINTGTVFPCLICFCSSLLGRVLVNGIHILCGETSTSNTIVSWKGYDIFAVA